MLPAHLKRYVVEQDYDRYTPVDQEVWRYIMRELSRFLSVHAHPCYLEGLKKTGIELDRIPNIHEMSTKLEKFGWRALPVSGFIPPAAFMEIQAHGFLPIASDMRTEGHLMYTPAPDIVHEAAGHAPILIDPEFAQYLRSYATVAQKAIISHEDLAQYEAIRVLSDIKEDPNSSAAEIAQATSNLDRINRQISTLSEAALLGRMNWWTAEYGLIGTLNEPRIYGAGLLSSLGEARSCLKPSVRKIPLTLDCITFSYDITEPQPQLFVTPSFAHLSEVLQQFAAQMAYQTGGLAGLEKARIAKTVNTVEFNSGVQISGILHEVLTSGGAHPVAEYLKFIGPTQICSGQREVPGQGRTQHPEGFGAPLGVLSGTSKCLSEMSESELRSYKLTQGSNADLRFASGITVRGRVTALHRDQRHRLLLVSIQNCSVKKGEQILFDPAWGTFDMAVGCTVRSVFAGPADRKSYGQTDDFVAKVIPRREWPALTLEKHRLYSEVRTWRGKSASERRTAEAGKQLEKILTQLEADFPHDWLLRLSLLELAAKIPSADWKSRITVELQNLSEKDSLVAEQIADGLDLIKFEENSIDA